MTSSRLKIPTESRLDSTMAYRELNMLSQANDCRTTSCRRSIYLYLVPSLKCSTNNSIEISVRYLTVLGIVRYATERYDTMTLARYSGRRKYYRTELQTAKFCDAT